MPTEEELIRQSRFIFRGTIQKLKAVTMAAVPVTDNMAIVKVDEVFQAPETLGDQTNKEITVQLAQTQNVEEGQQAVFYTNGWLYGKSLAVREVGHRPITLTASSRVPNRITRIAQKTADEELQNRIANADLVVVGKVSNIRPVAPTEGQMVREHAADWWVAVIKVEAIEKGNLSQDTLALLFPSSIDVTWHDVPKFHAGQEGIWILNIGQVPEVDPELYAVLTPLDFHEKNQLDRIRSLIAA